MAPTKGKTTDPFRPAGPEDDLASGERAYRRIHEAIQGGQLKPGARVREAEIAGWLGLSRTPVREALGRLESQGLLVHEPRRGLIVAELDHQMVTELYLMREVLEGTAAALAARHASDAEIAALRDMVAFDRGITGNPVRLAQNNRLFHDALYRGSHNRYLLRTCNGLRESLALLGPTTLALHGRPDTALDEHEAIVDAIERHDPKAAEEAARAHIRNAHRARLRVMFESDAPAAADGVQNT
ncbi:GntR family transcriptional regulator [Azospirillum sp.]|uniref:GntR family transcriptional regulator n=1 Tax=Azospirillum sp. TaxID=34012 RepID=UPI002D4C7BFF|nr:GntR family transcriptional regulator [Azospirillum sp.]HYD66895.1 GntR family transcriptional regulator [Azospirillum sp.]